MHVFRRLLALPIDFFERNPTGETTRKVAQIFNIRSFLTGKLVGTFLDLFTLVALLPFLFWMSATLAWMVLAASAVRGLGGPCVSSGDPSGFRAPHNRLKTRRVRSSSRPCTGCAPSSRSQSKSCATRNGTCGWPQAGQARLDAGRISNVAQTVVDPIEAFINRGVLLVGCYILISSPAGTTGITAGALIAFMMLGGRVVSPLIGLAKLMTDIEEVRLSVSQVADVLNHPTETAAMRSGLRPKFEGAISFQDLTFTYPGAQIACP